jgi:hypothetical protein
MALAPDRPVTTIYWDAEHEAERPSWDCAKCGRPWPCDPAREHMMAYLGWVALAVYMWGRLDEAVLDLHNVPAGELFERFLSWTGSGHRQ